MKNMRQRSREAGGATVEWVGAGALAVALVVGIATAVPAGVGATVADGLHTLVCRVAGQECGGGGAAPGPDGGDGAPLAGQDGAAGGGQPAGEQARPDAVPLDDLQLAAAAGPGGGGGGQADRLPRGGTRAFEPRRGQRLDRPGSLSRESGRFVDRRGNQWQWDPVKGEWDVQHRDGTHTNVSPEGEITHGEDNFPNRPRNDNAGQESGEQPSGDDNTARSVIVGGVTVAGVLTALWWGAKILSPACGPFAPACAIIL